MKIGRCQHLYSSIAQSVERMTVNHDVTGSSPVGGAKKEYSLSTVGVDDAGGPPVPIPNTEVKPCSAEDSALVTRCENRKMPTSDSECSSFYIHIYLANRFNFNCSGWLFD